MDKQNVHQAKKSKKTKTKKKPIKVVYISNPMKVNTSASEFRALVQKLTGQASDPTELAKLSNPLLSTGQISDLSTSIAGDGVTLSGEPENPDQPFEFFGDIFAQQMVDGFSGLMPFPLCS